MADFDFTEMFPLAEDTTEYRKLTGDFVGLDTFRGQDILTIEPEGFTMLTEQAFRDISHLLRPAHLQQLRNILEDDEATSNDKFVAYEFLKNAGISAGGVLPMCQDTGTAIVMGKKGQNVFTGFNEEKAIAKGVYNIYTKHNLRYSQMAPLDMFTEKNTSNNLPAQIELYATEGDAYKFMFCQKGGGSANKSFLFQETKAILNPDALMKFLDTKIRTLGTAACPPYHLAIVIGGTSAEFNMKTVKLASTKYLDGLPTGGSESGHAFRDVEMEQKVLKMTQEMGIGAQFGGKYYCHDIRVIRLPRHGASLPVGIGVSCSADRQAFAKITKDGIFMERLETDPAKFLPDIDPSEFEGDVVKIDLNRPMEEIRSTMPARRKSPKGMPPARLGRPRPAGWIPMSIPSWPPAAASSCWRRATARPRSGKPARSMAASISARSVAQRPSWPWRASRASRSRNIPSSAWKRSGGSRWRISRPLS